ncbi:STAS domain-containing protein [Nocardia sp. NPDC024068]|uniref:STAS domain-containing protein n=1 Tax=Nocardia sp. NPDC024068 TaxID=3157197 RepID=UPI0033E1CE82
MSVTTTLYQVDHHRKHSPRPSIPGRTWSRPSADHTDCVIARVEGELDAVLHDDFRDLLRRCGHSGYRRVVLDLRATTFMSLRAAMILASAKHDAWQVGVELRLVSGRKEVERALEVVGVRHQFRYYPTLGAALRP